MRKFSCPLKSRFEKLEPSHRDPLPAPNSTQKRVPQLRGNQNPTTGKMFMGIQSGFLGLFFLLSIKILKKLGHSTRSRFCLRVLDERNGSLFEGNRNRTIEKSTHNPKLWLHLSIEPATIYRTGEFLTSPTPKLLHHRSPSATRRFCSIMTAPAPFFTTNNLLHLELDLTETVCHRVLANPVLG